MIGRGKRPPPPAPKKSSCLLGKGPCKGALATQLPVMEDFYKPPPHPLWPEGIFKGEGGVDFEAPPAAGFSYALPL